jgi:hypothetical protein
MHPFGASNRPAVTGLHHQSADTQQVFDLIDFYFHESGADPTVDASRTAARALGLTYVRHPISALLLWCAPKKRLHSL